MGFNGVRKHQKIEDPRYLYWADVLGLLVWEEMPSAYRFTRAVGRAAHPRVDRRRSRATTSHPCIVAWVPFNESWGVPNLPDNPAERHYVQALYHLTKTLDPTRPVIGNDGWESVATDIIGIHDYDPDPERASPPVSRRRSACRGCSGASVRAAGCSCSKGMRTRDQPIVLSEFGGIALRHEPGTWGYSRCDTPKQFAQRVCAAAGGRPHSIGLFAGSATRSLPTPIRKPMACCMPTGGRNSHLH